MKVLLINPPLSRIKQVLNDYFPLGLGYLAAVLNSNGFEVRIYNADKGPEERKFRPLDNLNRIKAHDKYLLALKDKNHYVWREILKVIKEFGPDIVGISAMSTTYPSAMKVAEISKELNPGCKVIFGGPHPTAMPHEVLSNNLVDFVVRGEGEETIVDLLNILQKSKKDLQSIDGLLFKENGKIIHNKNRKMIEDLDSLPFPARELVMFKDLYLYPNNRMNVMITSRGCPFDCTFCQSKVMWGRNVRFRSISNIIEEITLIKDIYNPSKFIFYDDSFTINKQRVLELCKVLKESNIEFDEGWNCETRVDVIDEYMLREVKRAGCKELYIGIESGSNRILKEIRKNITVEQVLLTAKLLNKMRFIWLAFFMVGFPQETKEDIELTMKLMKKIKADRVHLCVFTPYPGCELYDFVLKMGLINHNTDWAKLSHHSHYNYFSPNIPQDEFRKITLQLAEYTERLNNNLWNSVRRAFNKRDVYIKKPSALFRGIKRNLKLIFDKF